MQIAHKILAPVVEAARPFLDKSVCLRLTPAGRLSVVGLKDGVQGEAVGAALGTQDKLNVTISTQHLLGALEFAKSRGADAVLDLNPDQHQILVNVEGASFAFPYQDQIVPPEVANDGVMIKGLGKVLKQVLPAVSDDPARVVLNGAYLQGGWIIGGDGARIHRAKIETAPATAFIAPSAWLKVVRVFEEGSASGAGGRATFCGKLGEIEVSVVAPSVSGEFPDLDSYFVTLTPTIRLIRERLLSTLQAVIQMGKNTEVQIVPVSEKQLGIRTDLGAVLLPIEGCDGQMHDTPKRYDAALLIDALVACGSKEVRVGFGRDTHLTIEPGEGSDFFSVVASRRDSK